MPKPYQHKYPIDWPAAIVVTVVIIAVVVAVILTFLDIRRIVGRNAEYCLLHCPKQLDEK